MALPQLTDATESNPADTALLSAARRHHATRNYLGPELLLSESRIAAAAQDFIQALPSVTPHFAVKCNPQQRVLQILKDTGCEFEVASKEELEQLLAINVEPANIFYSNPIKSTAYIRFAVSKGVKWFVVDSVEEVNKIHAVDPSAFLYLRIAVSNEGSLWPLESKFGCQTADAWEVIKHCGAIGADLAGVSFHVGSQCLNPQNWVQGIDSALTYFRIMSDHGLRPRLLNLGGGFPARINPEDPTVQDFAHVINRALEKAPLGTRVIAEPGRALVGSAGCVITEVVGTAKRGAQRWVYLDTGYYGGLTEFSDNFKFRLHTDRNGPVHDWTVAGPTCDSLDVGAHHVPMPNDLQEGDTVYIPNTGAYTNATATRFNGFDAPKVIFID